MKSPSKALNHLIVTSQQEKCHVINIGQYWNWQGLSDDVSVIFSDQIRLSEGNIFDSNSIARYGYVRIGLSTPEGSWHGMGNNGIVNDKIPMPCSDEDNMKTYLI